MAIKRGLKRKGAEYHHGDLRRALVEATLRLVAEHGMDGFTLRAAAKLAGNFPRSASNGPFMGADRSAVGSAMARRSATVAFFSSASATTPGV